MPRKRAFRCLKCSRTFILEESLNKHNLEGIHDPMKPRGGKRNNSGGPRENSGPTKDYTDEVIQPIEPIEPPNFGSSSFCFKFSSSFFFLMVGTRVHRKHEGAMSQNSYGRPRRSMHC